MSDNGCARHLYQLHRILSTSWWLARFSDGASCSSIPTTGDPTRLACYPNIAGLDFGHGGARFVAASWGEVAVTGGPSYSHYYYSSQPSISLWEIFSSIDVSFIPLREPSVPPREVPSLMDHLSVMVSYTTSSKSPAWGMMMRKRVKAEKMTLFLIRVLPRGIC